MLVSITYVLIIAYVFVSITCVGEYNMSACEHNMC
jgi:hypothetical protein